MVEVLCIDKNTDTLFFVFYNGHKNRVLKRFATVSIKKCCEPTFYDSTMPSFEGIVRGLWKSLVLESQFLGESTVCLNIGAFKVLKVLATIRNHLQKTTT